TVVPKDIPPPSEEPVEIAGITGGVAGGVPGGVPGGVVGGVVGGVTGGVLGSGAPPPPPPPPPPPKPKVRPKPQKIGGDVLQSKLIKKIEPVYPELAKRARVSGMVILNVQVNEQGRVEEIQVIRGNPLLNDSAVQAVRQWVYSPTLLNGEPVPVTATV